VKILRAMIKRLRVEGSEKWGVKWSEVKRFGGTCVLSWTYSCAVCMWVTVQYVLSHCLFAICFMSFTLCCSNYLFYSFNYSFYVCFIVSYVLLSILCVLCLCIVSPHVYSCLFSICVQFYRPLPPGGNPMAVKKNHMVLFYPKSGQIWPNKQPHRRYIAVLNQVKTRIFLIGAIPLCCNNIVIFYYRLKTQHILISNFKIFKILATCFGCKKPSLGQDRTKSRHNEGAHSMGSHIVYSYWYFKNHLLADTKLEKI
jgi:hypothetical protein